MVSLLLQRAANVNAGLNYAQVWREEFPTALHQASAGGLLVILGLPLESGADIEATSLRCGTPPMTAIYKKSIPALKFLVDRRADVNRASYTEVTDEISIRFPLEMAAYVDSPEMIRTLVENGAVNGLEDAYKHAQEMTRPSNRNEMLYLLDQQRFKLRNLESDQCPPAESSSY